MFIGDRGTHVVLLDRIPNLHIPHLLPSDRIFLLGVRLGLSLAVLQSFQFLIVRVYVTGLIQPILSCIDRPEEL